MDVNVFIEENKNNINVKEIAEKFNLSIPTVYRHLRMVGVKPKKNHSDKRLNEINKLRSEGKTYQEILPEWMQAINGLRKNDILPELKQILEENFIEESNGKWRLPNIQDDKDVNALRTKALLKEFKIYVDVAQKPKAKIKEARVEALRAGFKQCYVDKDFQTIVTVGNKIPQNLLTEDEVLLQFYDIAQSKL